MIKTYAAKSSATRAAKKALAAAADGSTMTVHQTADGRQFAIEPPAHDPTDDDMAEIGFYGLGSSDDTAECPHCGVNHVDNGYADAADGFDHTHNCLACGGGWGPVADGFAQRFAAAGGHQPRGICKALRTVAASWTGSRKSFLDGAAELGLNLNNAAAEWQVGRKA